MIWHVLGLFAIIVIYNVARYFLLDDGDDKSPKREPEPKNNEENVTIMSHMFRNFKALSEVDITKFNFVRIARINGCMYSGISLELKIFNNSIKLIGVT